MDEARRLWQVSDADQGRAEYAEALDELRQDPDAFERWVRGRMQPGEDASARRRKLHMLHGIWWDWSSPRHPGFQPSVRVRPELLADRPTVDALVGAAFGQQAEVRLVQALRGEPGVHSLVAERDGEVVGHCMLSPVHAPMRACALAPVAVHPKRQRQGIGGALVEAALKTAWVDHAACFVLGSPRYYGAWFDQAPPRWICPWPAPVDAFQVAFANPRLAAGTRDGAITYPMAFAAV